MDWIEQSSDELGEWISYGMSKGWISAPHCYTHDGPELTEEEDREFSGDGDPCIDILRLWV